MSQGLMKKFSSNTCNASYAFNKSGTPFPQSLESKKKPPGPENGYKDTKQFFPPEKELSPEEKILHFMSEYKKVERFAIVNFYTGGAGPYKLGMMDFLYSGLAQKANVGIKAA